MSAEMLQRINRVLNDYIDGFCFLLALGYSRGVARWLCSRRWKHQHGEIGGPNDGG